MKDISVLIELLGETNIEYFKKSVVDLLLERVKSDLEEWNDYIFYPPESEEFMEDIIKECREEIKSIVRNQMIKSIVKDLEK